MPRGFYDMDEVEWEDRAKVAFDAYDSMVFSGKKIKMRHMVALLEASNPAVRLAPPRSAFPRTETPPQYEDDTAMFQELYGRYVNSPHCSVHLDKGADDESSPFALVVRDPLNRPPADPIEAIRRLASQRAVRRVLVLGKFRAREEEGYLGIISQSFEHKNWRRLRSARTTHWLLYLEC